MPLGMYDFKPLNILLTILIKLCYNFTNYLFKESGRVILQKKDHV